MTAKTKFTAIGIALGLMAICSVSAWAGRPQTLSNAVVNTPVYSDVSAPLSVLAMQAASTNSSGQSVMHHPLPTKVAGTAAKTANAPSASPNIGPGIAATLGINVEGAGNTAVNNCPAVSGATVAPPDTNLAVGDTQVVQWVNLCYTVFNKSTGGVVLGPVKGNAFWAGMKSTCATANAGDPIMQWDKTNHVWVASQNVFGPYLTCIAISKTADATGAYNRYAFSQPGFPDYHKFGLTPTAYYQTQNDFGAAASAYVGVNVCAYDAVAMRAGKKNAKQVCILDNSSGTLFDDSMVPADDDFAGGSGSQPEVFLGSIDNPGHNNAVYMYTMAVNFKKGTATLSGVNGTSGITVPAFTLGCGGFGACVPQPSSGSEVLDSLGDRLMYRVAHQMLPNGQQSWVVTHSVNNTTGVEARWYQFTAAAGSTALTLAQSGDTPDDGHYRWMGSIAVDKVGDIALGYSRSSAQAGDYPSIYYSGQQAGEPAGTTDAEALILQGSGSQFNTANRWGDYSSMALDGADGCTFWYTTEYYPADGSFAWATQLASLKFPNCQ